MHIVYSKGTAYSERASERLLFDANTAIFQLYHGENKLIFNAMMMRSAQHAELNFYSASSLKQQSAGRHVAPLGHIIPIPSQPVFAQAYSLMLRV